MRKIVYIYLALSFSCIAYAGGNPERVSFPDGYTTNFKNYDTRNRDGKPQVAVLYANKIALDSANSSNLADGAKIVMEVYKAKMVDGKPITGSDGTYVKDKMAAVAVMEKRTNWDDSFDANERTGDWGYAIYNTNGKPKDNKLDCAGCHTPLPESDYLFSYSSLVEFVK